MTPYDSVERQQLEQRMKSGANWLYWIAALSLVTSIISLAGGDWGFLVSLGVTQLADAIANVGADRIGWGVKLFALVFDLIAAGLFALLGMFANKRQTWAFIVGMVLYLLDALVCLLIGFWLGLAFHAFALYSIYGGYKASSALELDKQAPPAPVV
ncbi:MAG TPA: hypothetical protein VN282_05325 [Pyrinomonadaceae bacterium]|nr:hypothetical protein [Pyrinomonadaceae bacterium]